MSKRDKRAQKEPRSGPRVPLKPVTTAAQPPQICIYCQERPADSEDHVIAKAFFGSKRPRCYVKVPACEKCNRGISKDEEYARTVIATEVRAAQHPVAAALLANEIQKSYERRPAFMYRIANAMQIVEARTPQGIIIPNAISMQIEAGRIARVMQKITRGLFYDLHKRALPVDWPVHVASPRDTADIAPVRDLMERYPQKTPLIFVGDEQAFGFRGATPEADQNVSIWFLVFYRSIVFVTDTAPRPKQTKP